MIFCYIEVYLNNIILLWPYGICNYNEKVALDYLSLKNNDVQLALTTILYNVHEFIRYVTCK